MRLLSIAILSVTSLLFAWQASNAQALGVVKQNAAELVVEYSNEAPTVREVQEGYKVMVPYAENGATKMREEYRTRKFHVLEYPLVGRMDIKPTPASHEFFDLKGNTISPQDFKNKAKIVLILGSDENITEIHRQALKESVFVLKARPWSARAKEVTRES